MKSQHSLQTVLRALAVAMVLGSGGVLWWASRDLPSRPAVKSIRELATAADEAQTPMPPFDPTRPLRRALVDVKPPPVAKPKPVVRPTAKPKPPSPPQLTLVMTVRGPGGEMAVVSDREGRYDSKGVGETLELTPSGATIRSIDDDRVTIELAGRQTELIIQTDRDYRSAKPRSSGSNARPATPDGGRRQRINPFATRRSP